MIRRVSEEGPHDTLIAAAYRAQADALDIGTQAKRRFADEYDAAHARGEVAGPSDGYRKMKRVREQDPLLTTADIGITKQEIEEPLSDQCQSSRQYSIFARLWDRAS
jgi:hypothetical protein